MEKQKQTMLEEIVPPLELCHLIPHPHFWNSAMCWRTFNKGRKDEYTIVFPTGTLDPWDDDIPAPTLQEILKELVTCDLKWEDADIAATANAVIGTAEYYQANNIFAQQQCMKPVPKTAEDALLMWFELIGNDKK